MRQKNNKFISLLFAAISFMTSSCEALSASLQASPNIVGAESATLSIILVTE